MWWKYSDKKGVAGRPMTTLQCENEIKFWHKNRLTVVLIVLIRSPNNQSICTLILHHGVVDM